MNKQELKDLEDRLWQAADNLRANSPLKASQYSAPLLGLIFLRFASIKYKLHETAILEEYLQNKNSRNAKTMEQIALRICGFFLPEKSRYDYLLSLPTTKNIPQAIKEAMEEIEKHRPELAGCLPKDEYLKLKSEKDEDFTFAKDLLKILKDIPEEIEGDIFGKVYEFFLGKFALAEGQGGGEFYTPTSVVQLMVEMIEPYGGTIFDPACGSGGMFVQSSEFVNRMREHNKKKNIEPLQVYGCEKEEETTKIARMNMFLHGLHNKVVQANSYYEDPHDSFEKFDFVMANPPFNVDDVKLSSVKSQPRFNKYGVPQNKTKQGKKDEQEDLETVPNANYLWINLFATSLKPTGRAALVMANSASDARNSEADIRERLVKEGIVSCMLSLPKNMFYTVTLPATLWFFDKSRTNDKRILFIDARNIFRQVDRAHREFTPEQIRNIACIRHLYYGDKQYLTDLLTEYEEQIVILSGEANEFAEKYNEELTKKERLTKAFEIINEKALSEVPIVSKETTKELKDADRLLKQADKAFAEAEKLWKDKLAEQHYFEDQYTWLTERFPNGEYEDVTGLCKAATLEEMNEQDYSLNPGRYVGVVIEEDGLTEEEFEAEMKERHNTLNSLNQKAKDLEALIEQNFKNLWQ